MNLTSYESQLFYVYAGKLPQHCLGQNGFTGLEELSGTASAIVFRKGTFHLNIDVVQIQVEVECFGFQVAVIPRPKTHLNSHVNLVSSEADISCGGAEVQVRRDRAVQLVH